MSEGMEGDVGDDGVDGEGRTEVEKRAGGMWYS